MAKVRDHYLSLRTPEITGHRAWSLPAHTGSPSLRVSFDQLYPWHCSTKPMSTMSWRSQVVILGGGIRTSPLTAALALPGWAERKSQVLEGEIPGLTSPNHHWQLPPTPARVPVLTHPQGCQGLKEVALSDTIIRDFIICFSSLRTNSSLQHANLLFKFQTPKWPSNTLLGMH